MFYPLWLYLYCQLLSGRELLWDVDGESLFSTQLQRVGILSWQELQRSDSHPHQMIPMNLLKALRYHRTDTLNNPVKTVLRINHRKEQNSK